MKFVTSVAVLLLPFTTAESKPKQVCDHEDNFWRRKNDKNRVYLETVKVVDPMSCAAECLIRTVCNGISWGRNSCFLLRDVNDSGGTVVNNRHISDYSPRFIWPSKLVGRCADHVTKDNAKCDISTTGVVHSIVTGCFGSPSVDQGRVNVPSDHLGVVWPLSTTLNYSCDIVGGKRTLPLGKLTCQMNGTWSTAICVRPFSRCEDVKRCNPSYKDGEYFLTLRNKSIRIYCHGMNKMPQMFVTFKDENYGKITAPYTEHPTCTVSNPHIKNFHCGTTYWRKGRIDARKLREWTDKIEIVRYDRTFVHETCPNGFLPLGSTIDCSSKEGCKASQLGSIRVSLAGTGLTFVKKGKLWGNFGPAKVVSEKLSPDGNSIDVTCKGIRPTSCGWCLPTPLSGVITVKIDKSYEPEPDSAISPKCTK